MNSFVETFVNQCINIGILTEEKIKKFKLQPGNIAIVLKLFALYNKVPFEYNTQNLNEYKNYNLFLTKQGYEWLINEFKKYTLSFLRSTFTHIFIRLDNLNDLDTFDGLNNFKGITGTNYKSGTKAGAILVRKQGVHTHELYFTTLAEAREEVINLTRFYPVENFTLYIVSKNKNSYYKNKVPLILESNRRGVPVNLPHLKGKL